MEKIKKLINEKRELVMYLIFGVCTFVVGLLTYALFNMALGMNELIANIFSWIVAVLFAYITNRKWVFESKKSGLASILKEMGAFFAGRLFTLAVEEVILFIFITKMGLNSMLIKIAAQIVVIILNYVISKVLIFRKK